MVGMVKVALTSLGECTLERHSPCVAVYKPRETGNSLLLGTATHPMKFGELSIC